MQFCGQNFLIKTMNMMHKNKSIFAMLLIMVMAFTLNAQLTTGDIAFVGLNADGDDDLAFVALDSIPTNTEIIFCDSEWNGTAFGTDEGDFTWNSGSAVIPAGTVISINNMDASLTPSQGSITVNNAGGFSGTSDAMFAFLGTSPRTVSTMLAAIANSVNAFGTLDNSGLIVGLTAVVITEGADIGQYNGTRSGVDANGYLQLIGDVANWLTQDGSGDQFNDTIAPDLPFDMTSFSFSATDLTAPIVPTVEVVDQFTTKVFFSEEVTDTSAINLSNYAFTPSITIDSATYMAGNLYAMVYHAGLQAGIGYTLSVNNIVDVVGNIMSLAYSSDTFFFNPTTPALVISEIMYNAPSDNSNQLEFVEIYNNSTSDVQLGGLILKDESNFVFTFPQMILAAESAIALATDKDSAEAFYGVTFIDLPQGVSNAFGNGGELIQILNTNGTVICEVEYDDGAPWPTAADGNGPSLELIDANGTINDASNWTISSTFVGQSIGEDVFASPGVFMPYVNAMISFDEEVVAFEESAGVITIPISITNMTATGATFGVNII